MALGNSYHQTTNNNRSSNNSSTDNNQNQIWEPSYYSRFRIKNPVENLYLAFTFWKGTLKVSIFGISSQDSKSNELAYIHLSPTKAKLFAECVHKVVITPDTDSVYGIDTGIGETRGFIAIGRNVGIPFIFIAKVNKDGKYESSQRFNFNNDYNYILKIHDISSLKYQKEYQNNIELTQFEELLLDYSRFASGALGASFYDIGRYENYKTTNMIRKIAEKVGAIDPKYNSNGNYSRNGGSNNSFFNSADSEDEMPSNSTNMRRSSYSDISDLEGELD